MVETDLGTATITYEDPGGGVTEETVANEHLAYFQDHWLVKTGERDGGDVVRRIPGWRVYFVERNVEAFEAELQSLEDHVDSLTDKL